MKQSKGNIYKKNPIYSKPDFCLGGFCRNKDGGAGCECPQGFTFEADPGDNDGRGRCVDGRREECYQEYRARLNMILLLLRE